MKETNETILEDLEQAKNEPLEELIPSEVDESSASDILQDSLQQEVTEWKDRYMRQAAELENYKKRNEREKADFLRRANEGLIKDLLPVLDNFERALENPGDIDKDDAFYQGVEMIRADIGKILGKHGLETLDTIGQPFDPNTQEAIMQQPDPSVPENTVIGQMQKGYNFQGRVLRPALVTVSSKG